MWNRTNCKNLAFPVQTKPLYLGHDINRFVVAPTGVWTLSCSDFCHFCTAASVCQGYRTVPQRWWNQVIKLSRTSDVSWHVLDDSYLPDTRLHVCVSCCRQAHRPVAAGLLPLPDGTHLPGLPQHGVGGPSSDETQGTLQPQIPSHRLQFLHGRPVCLHVLRGLFRSALCWFKPRGHDWDRGANYICHNPWFSKVHIWVIPCSVIFIALSKTTQQWIRPWPWAWKHVFFKYIYIFHSWHYCVLCSSSWSRRCSPTTATCVSL